MAKFIVPLPDLEKEFYIECKNKKEVEEFEKNDAIWEYEPFLKFLDLFDDKFGYSVSMRKSHHLFGGGITYTYTVSLYKIKE